MRKLFYIISILGLISIALIYPFWNSIAYFLWILIPYIIIGIHDILSVKHNILRNYPVVGHLRYIFEFIRPEIQQYFIEDDQHGAPYPRETRSLIYQQAKGIRDTIAFGTKNDVTGAGYHFSYHSLYPKEVKDQKDRLIFGDVECTKKYDASRLNISGMSYGALSPNAIRALNKGAKKGNFAHNTGEGGISPYHTEHGGDLIWQIGTGYFGCRHRDGSFNPDGFKEGAALESVKMIEIKLSQGAKPAHGGILPGAKVNEEIAKIRMLEVGQDAISPARHPAFDTPIGLLEFVQKLRSLSDGKPVGFKLCLGRRDEFMNICKAMIDTKITPDFITVDGAEGGTGAAPVTFTNHLGTPLNEAINFVNNTLVGIGVRNKIKLIASGKVATGYDLLTKIALGADSCNVARAMMFALGCVQSLQCNTDACPTGVATQNKSRWSAIDVPDKSTRVANFHRSTIHSFIELVGALGLDDPDDLHPSHIRKYINNSKSIDYATIYKQLETEELFKGSASDEYQLLWNNAISKHF